MGYSEEQVHNAFKKVSRTSKNKDSSSLLFDMSLHLRLDQVELLHSDSDQSSVKDCPTRPGIHTITDIDRYNGTEFRSHDAHLNLDSSSSVSDPGSSSLRACTSFDNVANKSFGPCHMESNRTALAMPPLRSGEKFEDVYDIVLVLDDREQFARNSRGSHPRKIIDNIALQFKIVVEVRRLPVGDGIWLARHKELDSEYVLDFIVERKEVDDLRTSIRDSRYKEQKLRLLRCGLQKLIYLVEGDPNSCEAAESIKTACLTTEILEGFDVHRTSGMTDTLKKYGYLTQAIGQYYKKQVSDDIYHCNRVCISYDQFIKKCQDLDKMTVSDVFAVQLLQVPQVTEETALAVVDLYPTILSLAHAYSALEGDSRVQEEMLRKQNNLISSAASRNIYKFIWGR